MAAGITDQAWSVEEFLLLRVPLWQQAAMATQGKVRHQQQRGNGSSSFGTTGGIKRVPEYCQPRLFDLSGILVQGMRSFFLPWMPLGHPLRGG
jgi:hypothetical protein